MPSGRTFLLSCLFALSILVVPSPAAASDYSCYNYHRHGTDSFVLMVGYPVWYSISPQDDGAAIAICQDYHNDEAIEHCAEEEHDYTLRQATRRREAGNPYQGFYTFVVGIDTVNWTCIDGWPYYAELMRPDEKRELPALAQLPTPTLVAAQSLAPKRRFRAIAVRHFRTRFVEAKDGVVPKGSSDSLAALPRLQSRTIEVFTMLPALSRRRPNVEALPRLGN